MKYSFWYILLNSVKCKSQKEQREKYYIILNKPIRSKTVLNDVSFEDDLWLQPTVLLSFKLQGPCITVLLNWWDWMDDWMMRLQARSLACQLMPNSQWQCARKAIVCVLSYLSFLWSSFWVNSVDVSPTRRKRWAERVGGFCVLNVRVFLICLSLILLMFSYRNKY